MKTGIHPTYNQITVTCSCGAAFLTGSVKTDMAVDICAKCHPFFTGEQRFVDQLGRVDKFKAKQKAATGKKIKKDRKGTQSGPQTLTDIRPNQA